MKVGDYVLGTKFTDGDPKDSWAVGFYGSPTGHKPERHHVLDENGQPERANGFRRVEAISREAGAFLIENKEVIEKSGSPVWAHATGFEADREAALRPESRRDRVQANMAVWPGAPPIGLGIPGRSGDPEADNDALSRELAEVKRSLAAANAAYEMVCEAIVPGMRNGGAAAMSLGAKLLHRRVEQAESALNSAQYMLDKSAESACRATAERIAAWLKGLKNDENKHVPLFDVETVADDFARRIREDEWKR